MGSGLYEDTILLLQSLENFIQDIESKSVQGDTFIIDNLTILTNSSIVLACTYLESYIRDAFKQSIDKLNLKLSEQNFPDNIIRWSILKGDEKKKLNLEQNFQNSFKIDDSDKFYESFIDKISGNIEITVKVFLFLGVNLVSIPEFLEYKEEIGNFIYIRNLVVHRNEPHPFSLGDLRNKIEVIKYYLAILDSQLLERDYLT
jgi:hypothetical protein